MHKLYIQNRFKVLNVNTLIVQNDTFFILNGAICDWLICNHAINVQKE